MYIKLFFLYLPTNSHTGFLPCCWPTHTYPPLLFERKPPDYPSAGPSVQLGQEWGRWPAHCSDTHTHTNRKNVHLQLRLHRLLEIIYLFIHFIASVLLERLQDTTDSQLVDKVVAEVLCDVFMPRLPHASSRRWSSRGQGTKAPHTIIHQTERNDRWVS